MAPSLLTLLDLKRPERQHNLTGNGSPAGAAPWPRIDRNVRRRLATKTDVAALGDFLPEPTQVGEQKSSRGMRSRWS